MNVNPCPPRRCFLSEFKLKGPEFPSAYKYVLQILVTLRQSTANQNDVFVAPLGQSPMYHDFQELVQNCSLLCTCFSVVTSSSLFVVILKNLSEVCTSRSLEHFHFVLFEPSLCRFFLDHYSMMEKYQMFL